MSADLPAWLAGAFDAPTPDHAKLAIARFGDEKSLGKGGFQLSSAAFMDGGLLDPSFCAQEEDAVAPPLEWSAPPTGAAEVVLLVECVETGACHWAVWGFPAQKGQLLEGEVPPRVGKNAAGNSEWLLPNPPAEAGKHHYVFQLFALDLPLVLMPGASAAELAREIDGHVVAASVITGTYARLEDEDEGEWDEVDIDDIDFDGN